MTQAALTLEHLGRGGKQHQTRRILVLVNPYASTVSARLKDLVIAALRGRYEVESVDTERPGHGVELSAAAARERFDAVVAFGGDGTINEAANGLAGSPTPLSVLPGGATNVYCRMLGIPRDVVDATEHLLALDDRWAPRRVDLAQVNGRAFCFAAGIGLDASVVRRVDGHPALKRRYGPWFYGSVAVGVFARRYVVGRPPRLEVSGPGSSPVEAVSAFVQNGSPYTFAGSRPLQLVDGERLGSGTLGGVALESARLRDTLPVIARGLSPWPMSGHRRVHALPAAREIRVRSLDGRPVPVQVDGDYVGEHDEALFTLRPDGLQVVA